jgi:hypothetical protein
MSDRVFGWLVFAAVCVVGFFGALVGTQPASPPAYEVIEASTAAELNAAVSAKRTAGWQLAPGFAVTRSESFSTYYQPMTKP